MNNKFPIGSEWKTRGGWKATVVWHYDSGYILVVHDRPGDVYHHTHLPDGLFAAVNSLGDLLTPWTTSPQLPEGATWPRWAKAAAMDSGGGWHWWDTVPVDDSGYWTPSLRDTFSAPMHPSERPNFTGNWKDSLIVRKEGE